MILNSCDNRFILLCVMALFMAGCSTNKQECMVIDMNQLNNQHVAKVKQMSKDRMAVFYFVHVKTNNDCYPLIIDDYGLYWHFFRNTDREGSFIDTVEAVLTRKGRVVKAETLSSYHLENNLVDPLEYAKIKQSGLNEFEVYEKYFKESKGWYTSGGFKSSETFAALAFLLDNNVIVEQGDLNGDIYINAPSKN